MKGKIREEHEIVRNAKNDPEQFRTLYDRYFFQNIFKFILRRAENEDTAADLSFADVFKGTGTYQGFIKLQSSVFSLVI